MNFCFGITFKARKCCNPTISLQQSRRFLYFAGLAYDSAPIQEPSDWASTDWAFTSLPFASCFRVRDRRLSANHAMTEAADRGEAQATSFCYFYRR
jgi:hypothetical protein